MTKRHRLVRLVGAVGRLTHCQSTLVSSLKTVYSVRIVTLFSEQQNDGLSPTQPGKSTHSLQAHSFARRDPIFHRTKFLVLLDPFLSMAYSKPFPLAQRHKPVQLHATYGPDLSVRLICPDCRDPNPNIVEEFGSGDLVCGSCGLVLGDRIVDTRSEWRVSTWAVSSRTLFSLVLFPLDRNYVLNTWVCLADVCQR